MKNFKLFLENAKEAKNKISSLGVYKVVRKKGGIDLTTGKMSYGAKELRDPLTGMKPSDFKGNKDGKKDDK